MGKTVQRLLVFFIGLPAVVALAFIKVYNHLPLNIAVFAVNVLAVLELNSILSKRLSTQNRWFVVILSETIPVVTYLYIVLNLSYTVVTLSIITVVFLSLIAELFFYKKDSAGMPDFSRCIENYVSTAFSLFYCGYLISYVTRMTSWEHSDAAIALFFLMVFGCDSIAWLFGVLLGKSTRGFVKVSPNKSLVGFLGGLVGSVTAGFIGRLFVPFLREQPLYLIVILGIATGVASIIGDLVESAFKRSAQVKDSGSIIPGRGGILDSIDSILFTAPIYHLLCSLFFGL